MSNDMNSHNLNAPNSIRYSHLYPLIAGEVSQTSKLPEIKPDELVLLKEKSTENIENAEKKVDKTKDGNFSLGLALKNFGHEFTSIARGIIQHPVRSLGIAVGLGVLTSYFPIIGRLAVTLGVVDGATSVVKGANNIAKAINTGNGDKAEEAFGQIGSGSSTLLLSGFFARGMAQVRGAKYLKSTKITKLGKVGDWFKTTAKATKDEMTSSYRNTWNFSKMNIKAFKKCSVDKSFNNFLKYRHAEYSKLLKAKNYTNPRLRNLKQDMLFSNRSIEGLLKIKELSSASWTFLPKAAAKTAMEKSFKTSKFMGKTAVVNENNREDIFQEKH